MKVVFEEPIIEQPIIEQPIIGVYKEEELPETFDVVHNVLSELNNINYQDVEEEEEKQT